MKSKFRLLAANCTLCMVLSVSAAFSNDSPADHYYQKGASALYRVYLDSARTCFQNALRLYSREPETAKKWDKIVGCWNALGDIHRQYTDFDSAKVYLRQGLRIARDRLKTHHPGAAKCYLDLGLVYENLGRFEEARHCFEKALRIRKKLYGDKHLDIAEVLARLGRIDFYENKSEIGAKRVWDAHNMRLELVGENDLSVASSYITISAVYVDHDMPMYRDCGQKALNLCLKLFGERHPIIISANNNLAVYSVFIQDFKAARDYLLQNDRLISEIYGKNAFQLIGNNTNLAGAYCALNDYERAVDYHKKVQKILLDRYGENVWYANSLNYLGGVYALKGDYEEALEYYQKSFDAHIKLGVPIPNQLRLLYDVKAALYLKIRDYPNALQTTQKLLSFLCPSIKEKNIHGFPSNRELTADEALVDVFAYRGQVFREYLYAQSLDRRDLDFSLKNYEAAVAVLDQLQAKQAEDISRIMNGEKTNEVCNGALMTAWRLYELESSPSNREKLHFFMEKAKCAALAYAVHDEQARRSSGIPDSLLRQATVRQARLAQLKTDIHIESAKMSERDSLKLFELHDDYFLESQAYQKLVDHFERQYPRYHRLKYGVSVPTIAQIQDRLDGQTAVLEYYIGDSLLYSLCSSRSFVTVAVAPIDTAFSHMCEDFAASIKADRTTRFRRLSVLLHEQLIAPHEHHLLNKARLVVIPHGALTRMPFEALTDGNDRYLIERFAISYHLSATLFHASHERNLARRTADDKPFLGLAPVFRQNSAGNRIVRKEMFNDYLASLASYYSIITRDGEHYTELPFSRREVQRIADEFRRRNLPVINYFDNQASEEHFKLDAQRARYVHLATHSFVNEKEPSLSGIAFYQPAEQVADLEDGVLYAEEIYSLKLDADLMVLSSCESGIGKLMKSEGMLGFTRGFFYAGARNILVSLWKVDDRRTGELMVEFYHRSLAGAGYAEALRAAKLVMLRNPKTAKPLFWSGFVLIGQ
ncbi:CHAT domain-containing protein [candidate division KSB1 bacterium]|nr:CHAT domain-containing protein [candidate division KSB1 bacterium]RQW07559.1 MAG: CHAT domain-containing protein [candidate division KSB1 bacterium]